jgi:hypothetical protein
VTQKTFIHFLIIVVLVLSYLLYEKDKENLRLYKICTEQDSVIKLQHQAMQSQAYLKYLESYYNNYYQNENSPVIQ